MTVAILRPIRRRRGARFGPNPGPDPTPLGALAPILQADPVRRRPASPRPAFLRVPGPVAVAPLAGSIPVLQVDPVRRRPSRPAPAFLRVPGPAIVAPGPLVPAFLGLGHRVGRRPQPVRAFLPRIMGAAAVAPAGALASILQADPVRRRPSKPRAWFAPVPGVGPALPQTGVPAWLGTANRLHRRPPAGRIWFPPAFATGPAGPAVPTYPDLWAALQAWITAQVPALTGGVWATRAGGGRGFPYAAIDSSPGADDSFNTAGEPLADGTFTVSVYAALKPDADALARAVRLAIKDAPLAFAEGRLIYLRGKNLAGAEADPDPGPDNETVYQAVLMARYMVQRPA